MQSLQRVIDQIKARLGVLPRNARLLVGSLMIILVMGLLLVSQYAGRADLAPLGLPQDANIRVEAARHLRTMRIEFEDRGDDIYVPASRQYEVIGALSAQEIVSANQIDFNALIQHNANPFIGRDQAAQNWQTAKMNVLSAMIAARSDVSMARVIIDTPRRTPGIGSAFVASKATIMIRTNGVPLTQDTADSLGRMVAGSQSGLKVENVTVTDISANRSFIPRSAESMLSGGYLEHKQKTESHFRRMIQEQISIPGSIVSVNAVVKNTRISSKETTFDDPTIGPQASENRDYSAVNTSRNGEAGVRPNAGAAITGSGGRDSEVTESSTREDVLSKFGGRDRVIEDHTGYPIEVNAIVAIPRSHFVRVWQAAEGDDTTEPDAQTLDTLFQQKKADLENDLALLIRTGDLADTEPGELRVRMYDDFDVAALTGGVEATLAGNQASGGLFAGDSLVKSVGLGALALVSLFMMFLMVRRAGVREKLPTAGDLVGLPPAFDGEETDFVSEAEVGHPPLEGKEIAEGDVRTQQLVDQISELVTNDPTESVALFNRWLDSD